MDATLKLKRFACSVMVIIDASQALDPGSIPGRRIHFDFCGCFYILKNKKLNDVSRIWTDVGRAHQISSLAP